MTRFYKATRPDGTSLGKLGEDSSHFGVVGGAKTPFAHIALRTRKNQVVDGVVSALRQRCQVIQVKCASVISEKLEHTALVDSRPSGAEAAMGADAAISLRNCVSQPLRNVFMIFSHADKPSGHPRRHAARGAALALLARDLITEEHFNILYGPWAEVIEGKQA